MHKWREFYSNARKDMTKVMGNLEVRFVDKSGTYRKSSACWGNWGGSVFVPPYDSLFRRTRRLRGVALLRL